MPAEYEWSLRADEVTFAEVFRRAGYRTFYLDPDWQPSPDWWGSQAVAD